MNYSVRTSFRFGIMRFLAQFSNIKMPRVLMYHSIDPSRAGMDFNTNPNVFLKQISYLSESGANFITLDDVLNHLRGEISLLDNSVCVTFDDGYKDNLTYALPVLERFNVPAAIYVATEFVDRGFGSKGLSVCSWDDLKHASSHPLITIGGHTVTHPKLSLLDDDAALHEIVSGRFTLQEKLGVNVRHFAYPKGDYNIRTPHLVEMAGFDTAVTVRQGLISRLTYADAFTIPRIAIDDKVPFDIFKACGNSTTSLYYDARRFFSRLKGDLTL